MGSTAKLNGRRGLSAGAVLLVVLVGAFGSAPGAGASGDAAEAAYAARVEPICKAETPTIEQLLSGTRQMANNGQPIAAGRRFVRASNVFAGIVRKVAAVHRPGVDAARLGKWIDRLHNVKEGLRRVGSALKQRNRLEALNRVGQLRDAGTSANKAVKGFHLRYCRIYESRFS